MKLLKKHSFWLFFVVTANFLHVSQGTSQSQFAQSELAAASERPPALVLPWQSVRIMPEVRAGAQKALERARRTWLTTHLPASQNLVEWLAKRAPSEGLPLNLKRRGEAIAAGRLPAEQLSQLGPLIAAPTLCSLGDYYLVMMSLSHRDRHHMLALGHHLIAKNNWARAAQANTLPELLSQALEQAWQRSLANHRNRPNPLPNAFQLGLSLGHQNSRYDQGASLCLNLLVGEKLIARGYQLPQLIGKEDSESIDRLLPTASKPSRASRHLVMYWLQAPTARSNLTSFTFTLRTSRAEAVFASPIPPPPAPSTWSFTPQADGSLAFSLEPELLTFLAQEQQALALGEAPQISKVHRAWVYLDKGRAWGLKMNDRLLVEGAEDDIKGHVVGFFGSELNLSSPAGFPIYEGAIVYIRQGQHLTEIGQKLKLDPQTFPSPWPPKALKEPR